jgi:hypothetical protein
MGGVLFIYQRGQNPYITRKVFMVRGQNQAGDDRPVALPVPVDTAVALLKPDK